MRAYPVPDAAAGMAASSQIASRGADIGRRLDLPLAGRTGNVAGGLLQPGPTLSRLPTGLEGALPGGHQVDWIVSNSTGKLKSVDVLS